MEYREAWAVDIARIGSFFLSLKDAEAEGPGPGEGEEKEEEKLRIRCGECVVKLSPLPSHPVGPVEVPRTQVEISGPEEAAGELYRRFFLRFISAGG